MAGKIRIGAPAYLAIRPLIFGFTSNRCGDVEVTYDEPGRLATALARGTLDAALVPSIEYLRGTGHYRVGGPALIAGARTGSLLLVTQKPIENIERIAVSRHCRTPVAALRIVLDRLHAILPDLCVLMRDLDWRQQYDGVLLTGDRGLDYLSGDAVEGEACYDLGEMWRSLFSAPLVISFWAYNDERLGERLTRILTESRNFGIANLSLLADGISRTCAHDSHFLYEYFSTRWSYDLGSEEEEGLQILEQCALEYHLIQHGRLERIVLG